MTYYLAADRADPPYNPVDVSLAEAAADISALEASVTTNSSNIAANVVDISSNTSNIATSAVMPRVKLMKRKPLQDIPSPTLTPLEWEGAELTNSGFTVGDTYIEIDSDGLYIFGYEVTISSNGTGWRQAGMLVDDITGSNRRYGVNMVDAASTTYIGLSGASSFSLVAGNRLLPCTTN